MWGIWLQVVIALSILTTIAFWVISASSTPAGRDSVKIYVAELRSQAAEGQLLAEQALADGVTSTYLRSQASQLQDHTQSVLKGLQSLSVESGLETDKAQAESLGGSLNDDLKRLADSFVGQEEIDRLKNDFAGLFSNLLMLESSLQQ